VKAARPLRLALGPPRDRAHSEAAQATRLAHAV